MCMKTIRKWRYMEEGEEKGRKDAFFPEKNFIALTFCFSLLTHSNRTEVTLNEGIHTWKGKKRKKSKFSIYVDIK